MRWISIALILCLPAAAAVADACGSLNSSNAFITFTDAGAVCSVLQPVCPIGSQVTFSVVPFGYSFACATHTFAWDFGDGSAAVNGMTATHTFTSPGIFDVSLQIASPNGTTTLHQTVLTAVVDPVPPMLTFASEHVSGLDIVFTPHSLAVIRTLTWNFGDGTTSISSGEIRHHYTSPGTYTVKLGAQTDQGAFLYSADVTALAPRQRAVRH